MTPTRLLPLLLLCLLLVSGVSAAHPSSYINPYAYEVRWIQQGVPPSDEQGVCTGATLAYILELQRLEANGNQPTYTPLPQVRNAWVNTSTFNATVDIPPPNSFSVYSMYHNFIVHHYTTDLVENEAMAASIEHGGNFESDWITAKNHMTAHYYPQTHAWSDGNRTWATSCHTLIEGTRDDQWEQIKEQVYHNHVVGIRFNTTNTMHGGVGADNNFIYSATLTGTSHAMAVIGYNETKSPEEIYVLNSWGESMWGHDYPKIIGMTETQWSIIGSGGYVPKR
jgi:hypothetical protein